jgi:hypothetical protein
MNPKLIRISSDLDLVGWYAALLREQPHLKIHWI